ncbi:spermatogenesis-associated protein 4 isoform X2 [Rhinatrema bivittatum]|uniref:spermatogenesis-associated protein 4 isoform X2 n=1 Tax=Rhinatrema bivittatum TaxID=194408 RepID=UPI001126DB3A|nr:spermatogenesis-associated protein 4 isoform X2 [Rhinatrema bivittatum]XP_029434377.1 spermatogenesis-associated protein 4 isoform X2 [Rhinatrema bivittatum]
MAAQPRRIVLSYPQTPKRTGLPRDLLKWLQSLDLTFFPLIFRRDLSNGYIIAEIFFWYYPEDIQMHSFRNGNSLPIKLGNWAVLERFFRKRKLNFSKEMIDGTIHCKPGAAEALLQSIYITLTSRGIQVIRDEKVDLTDTAYQKMLPMVARPTATKAVKNNIRITEIMSQQDILTNQQKIQTIIDRHLQHRHEERIEDPKRFNRMPTLGELAARLPPSPSTIENMYNLLKQKRSKSSSSSSSLSEVTSKESVHFKEIQVKQAPRSDMSTDPVSEG